MNHVIHLLTHCVPSINAGVRTLGVPENGSSHNKECTMPTSDKNQGNDRSRQGATQDLNQGSKQASTQSDRSKQQAGSSDTQSGLSGKSGSDDTMKKSGSSSDSNR